MSDIPIVSNPLGWAQLQLVGGWRRFWMLAAIYGGIILFVASLIYRGTRPDLSLPQFAGGAMTLLIFVQVGLFFLVGTNQLRRAIQRDFTTDMITSHRLTAMSGPTAVLGYLTGALAQVASMTFVNWTACNIFLLMIGPGPGTPLVAPTMLFIMLGVLALTCWVFAVLVALATRGKTAITGLLIILAVAGNLTITAALPGLFLLLSIGRVALMSQSGLLPDHQVMIFVSMILQAAFAIIFFIAAARKYHRDDVIAFSPALAYVLLGLWTLTSALALRFWPPDDETVIDFFAFAAEPSIQWGVTLTSLALLSCLPIASSAQDEARWARRTLKDPDFAPPRPRRYYEAAIICTLVVAAVLVPVAGSQIGALVATATGDVDPLRASAIPVSFLLALLTMSGLMRFCYSVVPNGFLFGGIMVFLLWFLPLLLDLSIEVAYDRPVMDPKSIVFTASPVGIWMAALRNLPAPVFAGLAVQLSFAGMAQYLARRRQAATAPAV